jgi:hypothetical protein
MYRKKEDKKVTTRRALAQKVAPAQVQLKGLGQHQFE